MWNRQVDSPFHTSISSRGLRQSRNYTADIDVEKKNRDSWFAAREATVGKIMLGDRVFHLERWKKIFDSRSARKTLEDSSSSLSYPETWQDLSEIFAHLTLFVSKHETSVYGCLVYRHSSLTFTTTSQACGK